MEEGLVIATILNDRKAYDQLAGHLDTRTFSEQGRLCAQAAVEFYKTDPGAPCVDRRLFPSLLGRMFPNEKHVRAMLDYVASLPDNLSTPNIVQEYRRLQRHNTGLQLAGRLGLGEHDDDTEALWRKYGELAGAADESEAEKLSFDDLVGFHAGSDSIRLTPSRLDDAVEHAVSRGHNITIYGRPESGKTAFGINLTAGFLAQGLRVLYTGNEEPIADLQIRLLSRISRIPVGTLKADKDMLHKAIQRGEKRGYQNLVAKELLSCKIAEVEAQVRRHKPDVLVVDQLKNLKCPGEGNRALELDTAAREIRRLGKAYGLVTVSITQAGESAEGKLLLGMTDIEWSNTGIPGAADLLIGIGVDAQWEITGRRMIHLAKNKISGRHDHFPLFFYPQYSLFTSKLRKKQ